MELEGTTQRADAELVERAIHDGEPLVRVLAGRLGLRGPAMALVALGWGLVYLFVLPALFGSLTVFLIYSAGRELTGSRLASAIGARRALPRRRAA